MPRSDPRWAYLLVVLATFLWATNITLGRALRNDIGPVSLTAARFFVGGLIFIAILNKRSTQSNLPINRREWLLWAGMSLCGVFGFPIILYLALQFTTASRAALINAAGPLMTALLAALFLRERLSLPLIVGSLVSLVGVGLVISASTTGTNVTTPTLVGDLLALITALLWGIYSIMARVATQTRSSLQVTAFTTWLALPLLIPAAGLEWRVSPPDLSLPLILAAIYIGIFPTIIAFVSWNEGVRRVGPNQAMAFYNLMPVFGTLLAILFLDETLTLRTLLGGVLVIGGGMIVALIKIKRAE